MLASLPEPAEIPFVSASLDKLESVLVDPLNRGRNGLRKPGSEIGFGWNGTGCSRQWERLWMPAIE
jgi:hypothetical protein